MFIIKHIPNALIELICDRRVIGYMHHERSWLDKHVHHMSYNCSLNSDGTRFSKSPQGKPFISFPIFFWPLLVIKKYQNWKSWIRIKSLITRWSHPHLLVIQIPKCVCVCIFCFGFSFVPFSEGKGLLLKC